jgi:hypothetical protein
MKLRCLFKHDWWNFTSVHRQCIRCKRKERKQYDVVTGIGHWERSTT